MIEEIEIDGQKCRYRKLRGEGPDTGWVKMKQFGKTWLIEPVVGHPSLPWDETGGTLRAEPLAFGEEPAKAFREKLRADMPEINLLLCSDCVYEPMYGKWAPALMATIEALCGQQTVLILSTKRRLHDGVDKFLALLLKAFVVKRVFTKGVKGRVDLYVARRRRRGEEFYEMIDEAAARQYSSSDDDEPKSRTTRGRGRRRKASPNKGGKAAGGGADGFTATLQSAEAAALESAEGGQAGVADGGTAASESAGGG